MHVNSRISKSLTHAIGWMTIIGISFFIPTPRFISHNELYVALNSLVLISAFYMNYYVLVPRIYLKRSFGIYLFCALCMLILAWLAFTGITASLSDPSMLEDSRFPPGSPTIDPSRIKYIRSVPLTVLTLIGMLISSLLALQENYRRKELEIASVKASLLDQELKMLRSQINPHFLFNALNNIYAMSINQPIQVGPNLLKLSEMLRYSLYDIGEKEVSINKEISYISNYIELLKLKDPTNHQVTFNYSPSELKINPMILIVFVENSFKHGKIGQSPDAYVHINLQVQDQRMLFEIKNSIPSNNSMTDQSSKGIGIDNAKKRLALVYPGRHELVISQRENEFQVKLSIVLQ